jgi:hypothetical protein
MRILLRVGLHLPPTEFVSPTCPQAGATIRLGKGRLGKLLNLLYVLASPAGLEPATP